VRLACALVVAALIPTAAALVPVPTARAALTRLGRQPAPPAGARVQGMLAPAVRLHVSIALRPRDAAALASYAHAVSTAGSPAYRRYLTPEQFAGRFGATPTQVNAVRSSLRAQGLTPGPVSHGALSISVVATAAQLERAFSISLRELALPGRRTAIAASAGPAVQAWMAPAIQSIVGLNTTSAPRPLLARAPRPVARSPLTRSHVVTGGPQPCAAAQAAAPTQSAFTADQIASAYGFPGVYAAGNDGGGITVAIYELEPNDANDIAAYQSCYGTHATISYVPVDGGAGSGPGSGEAALDIENLIGLAPRVNVLVYQGPNSNSGAPGSGPYDTFSAIINQDRARVITVSWGQCEAALGQTDAAAENTLFQQATVQGQSIIAAAGDSGAEDCNAGGTPPQTGPAVDDPSSQPFVTGVGGTSLHALGPRPSESVWNSGGTVLGGAVQPGAGGGGVSNIWGMPSAQLNASPSLGVRSSAAAGAACSSAAGFCRLVPDVSADGDPSTGYLIYWNGGGHVPGQPAGWQGIGGTSGAAPLWAAVLTLADGAPACAGAPVGYADPALYRAAGAGYAANFNDITMGENDFTGTNGGNYAARAGYDPASGLGTPNASSLVPALCADTVRLPNPGAKRSAVHAAVSVRLRASDTAGAALRYAATNLPPGLKLNAATGLISGRLTAAGRYTVRVSVHDDQASTASATFGWTVGGAPRISRLSLTRSNAGPVLAFTVTAGRDAPALQTVAITVSHDLSVAGGHGVTITTTSGNPAPLRFTARSSHASTLTVRLQKPSGSMRVRIAPPSLATHGGRVPASVLRAGSRQILKLSVTDSSAGRTQLTEKVAVAAR
jgi:subtilase family serine protease